mgnify:CR=1 FL=1|jgi:site-specific recombinase XerD
MAEAYFDEAPFVIKDFLSYMETIKGKSKNTVHEYYYDLRLFFRFMKVHNGLEENDKDFEKIEIRDIDIDMIKK